jgi:hypothetical protein
MRNLNYQMHPLLWWASHSHRFPRLGRMAADYFAVPATSVPSEQVFSQAGDLISKKRNSMAAATAETLLCLK